MTEEGGKGDELARLHCLDRQSGTLQWSKPIFASGVLAVTPRQILIQDKKNHLTSLDKQGKVQWTAPVGSLVAKRQDQKPAYLYPMAASNIIVVATPESAGEVGLERKPALLALDRGSGTLLWRVPLSGKPHTSPYVVKKTIYFGTPTGLEARSLLDGKLLPGWECQAGPPSAEFAVGEKTIVYVNQAGELVVIDRENGSVKGRVGGCCRAFRPCRAGMCSWSSRKTAWLRRPSAKGTTASYCSSWRSGRKRARWGRWPLPLSSAVCGYLFHPSIEAWSASGASNERFTLDHYFSDPLPAGQLGQRQVAARRQGGQPQGDDPGRLAGPSRLHAAHRLLPALLRQRASLARWPGAGSPREPGPAGNAKRAARSAGDRGRCSFRSAAVPRCRCPA